MSQLQIASPENQPVFPPELEREIFERAVRIYPSAAVTFALVSRRVQIWVENILYENVILSTDIICTRFLYTISARSPSFFAANVKSLCIPGDIDPINAGHILSVCQGVVNLAYWITTDPPLPSVITSLRPKRLSINTGGLFGQNLPDFGHPFFANVTHLEIVDWPWIEESFELALLPCLTHLGVDLDHYCDSIINRLRNILSSCRTLLVLLCLVPTEHAVVAASDALASLDDHRLVILSDSEVLENWEASLMEGSDSCQWDFAEALINAKKNPSRDAALI